MLNARLDEAEAGIMIAERSINKLRYSNLLATQFSLVQLLSHVRLFATPGTSELQAAVSITPGLRVHHQLPEFTQTHVH